MKVGKYLWVGLPVGTNMVGRDLNKFAEFLGCSRSKSLMVLLKRLSGPCMGKEFGDSERFGE